MHRPPAKLPPIPPKPIRPPQTSGRDSRAWLVPVLIAAAFLGGCLAVWLVLIQFGVLAAPWRVKGIYDITVNAPKWSNGWEELRFRKDVVTQIRSWHVHQFPPEVKPTLGNKLLLVAEVEVSHNGRGQLPVTGTEFGMVSNNRQIYLGMMPTDSLMMLPTEARINCGCAGMSMFSLLLPGAKTTGHVEFLVDPGAAPQQIGLIQR